MGFSADQDISPVQSSSIFGAIRLLQLICCLGAAVSAACLTWGWTCLTVVALLLAVMYGLSWEVLSARARVKSPGLHEPDTRGRFSMFTEPWEMRGGSLELVQDAVICIFFTLCSAALLLNNALAQRDPSMLSSMSHNGGPNIYVVYGRNSGFSSAWTALFVTAVVNAILFAVSTVMLAVWLVSGPSACNTKHTFVATGTPYPVSTLVATV